MRIHAKNKDIPKAALIIFPVAVTLVVSLVIPDAAALIGFLMFGNLIRECGVLEKLSKAAQNELSNIVTLLLGISVGATMTADKFLTPQTLLIMIFIVRYFFYIIAAIVILRFAIRWRKKRKK